MSNQNEIAEKSEEYRSSEISSRTETEGSELDSIGSVSSDGGEYQDLPIIVDKAQGNMHEENKGDEQGSSALN